ncbi:MFS transporter [Prosthecomicrobium pneumaticum]|uniref:DHA1 family purine ribonucleoside efflux pump-like MFS transporter n=1 Tax=Prosthecomicrobium pneumaticum TaxID=81895 RepID=A0A7W9CUZ5_9HYPH|nr:MFS transporter [Prosthecomicrobium pneumaticum]MBB5751847.1 DHA1 family purine ribonucleoside efflux pump-like MFS transporter [Prosthecomicrobium pneumaticum]
MSDLTLPISRATPERADAAWPAIVSLSLGVFGLVTAEFLPASILTPMAADLSVSEGLAGQAVTATAIVGAIAGPAVVLGTGRFDRRIVLLALTVLLVVSNAIAATAESLAPLLVSRVLLGIGLGGFWSMSAALAMRLAPPALMPRAMAVILTGVSLATVCAAPVGAFIGDRYGWRTAFIVAGALAVLALVAQLATVPALPPRGRATLGTFAALFHRPAIRAGLLVVLLVVSAHFAGFTYIRPFLESVPRMPIETISATLLAFGIGGFFGNLAGGVLAGRSAPLAAAAAAALIALGALALAALGGSVGIAAVATAVWGFGFGAIPVAAQSWITRAAADQAESAGGLMLVAFQVAITLGAGTGGLLVDGFGPLGPIVYGAMAAAIAATTAVLARRLR